MTATLTSLKKGDRIVHQRHGVGEIVSIDTRNISGGAAKYYRMKTTDSLVWLSVADIENEPIRTLSTTSFLDEAMAILGTESVEMSDDKNVRSRVIKDAKSSNDLTEMATMMRDLAARDANEPLLYEEKQALKALITRFANEISMAKEVTLETARGHLKVALKPQTEKVKEKDK